MGRRQHQFRRHQRSDIQEVLELFDEMGWRIDDSKGYYKLKCPCPSKHMKTIHLTPSDPNYAKNAKAWLYRQECSKGRGK